MLVSTHDSKGNEIKYPLSLVEALIEVKESNAWIQGKDFKDGLYLKMGEKSGILEVHDATPMSRHEPFQFTISQNGLNASYRVIHTGTEAQRKL